MAGFANHYDFYSKSSALQLNFIPPTIEKSVSKGKSYKALIKHGALLLSLALGKDRKFDWSNKITFAISVKDLPFFYAGFYNFHRTKEINIKIMHDPHADSPRQGEEIKNFVLSNGKKEGSFMLAINLSGKNRESRSAYYYFNLGEFLLFKRIIEGLTFSMADLHT